MDTIFMNSENSRRSDSHRILLNFKDKVDLGWMDKVGWINMLLYQILANTIH